MYPNCTYAFNALIATTRARIRHLTYLYGVSWAFLLLISLPAASQCIAPSMVFKTPTLISGVDGSVGAVYKFANVTPGVDATIQVMALVGGAGLNQMDNTSQGYFNAWQPYVTAGGNGTSYLDWKIVFKKGGTNIDTLLPCLAITAVDIDGDGSRLKEFIVASTPGAYAVDPNTYLNVSFDGVNSTAVGTVLTVPNIDTSERRYMFQMNFSNVGTIYYRNGSISTKASFDVRHTCIYFKPFFFEDLITLPIRLTAFTAKIIKEGTLLQWNINEMKDIQNHTVQKSTDGVSWSNIGKLDIQDGVQNYNFTDRSAGGSRVYYRLQQTDVNNRTSLSRMLSVNYGASTTVEVTMPTIVTKLIPVNLESPAAETYNFAIYNSMGSLINQRNYQAQAGPNSLQLDLPASSAVGTYVVAVRNAQGAIVTRKRIVLQ